MELTSEAFKSIQVKKEKYEFSDLQTLINDIKSYKYCLIYKTDSVKIMYASEVENLDNLLEIRAFDKEKELHLIRYENTFLGKITTENIGDEVSYIDDVHALWGNDVERGISVKLPFDTEKHSKVGLIVRNYMKTFIDEDALIADIVFDDYRPVDFVVEKGRQMTNV